MFALFLTTTITCSQAFELFNRIQTNRALSPQLKTELLETIRETIPTCPVIIKENERRNTK